MNKDKIMMDVSENGKCRNNSTSTKINTMIVNLTIQIIRIVRKMTKIMCHVVASDYFLNKLRLLYNKNLKYSVLFTFSKIFVFV